MTPAHHSLYKWWSWVDLDLFYGKVKFNNKGFSIGKKWKLLLLFFSDFLRPVTWNCIKLWRYVSIEGQGHFLTLTQSQLHMKLKTGFSQNPLGQSKPNFICKLSGSRKWKFIDMMLVTWPRWPPPIYGKNPSKIFLSGTMDRFPRNLVCSIGDSCPS